LQYLKLPINDVECAEVVKSPEPTLVVLYGIALVYLRMLAMQLQLTLESRPSPKCVVHDVIDIPGLRAVLAKTISHLKPP
jgi:hypothetical protein